MRRLRARVRAGERGETLAEILVTIGIMGILFAAVLGALAVSEQTSDISKKEGSAEALMRSYAEQIQGLSYVSCASKTAYTIAGFPTPSGYTVGPTAVRYWDGNNPANFTTTCPATDQGVQAVDLQAKTGDGRVNETMTIYKRVP